MNRIYSNVFVAVAAVLALLAAACSGDGDGAVAEPAATEPVEPEPGEREDPGEAAPTTTASTTATATTTTRVTTTTTAPVATAPTTTRPQSPPYRVELPSGLFILADRIAQKLTLNQTLSLVMSVVGSHEQSSGPALEAGFAAGAAETSERHSAGVEARAISADGTDQGALIDEIVLSGQADCVAVEVPGSDPEAEQSVATAIDLAVSSGVPVFTVSRDSDGSRRFAFYGLDELAAGTRAGEAVGRWAVEGRILLRKAGVLAGDAGDAASRQLMEGFMTGLSAELPDIEFVNGPGTMESFGFDPVEFHDEAGEWILAHPGVDIIFLPDTGLEPTSRFIAERALYGDVSLAGFEMSEAIGDYIREGVVVAAMAPGLSSQAAAAAEACGDFLLAGAHRSGAVAVDPLVVTGANVDERDWTLPENR